MQWPREGALIMALTALPSACAARPPCDGIRCPATCPRGAAHDSSGRCACLPDSAPLLGACVPPAVADAYCGPAARYGVGGCSFRPCADGTALDAATGACLSKAALVVAGASLCGEGKASIVSQGRSFCVPQDAACPRGTVRDGALCAGRPLCPPGTLVDRGVCRPLVTVGGRGDLPRVDLGAWAGVVLGVDGGPGTPDLCRPLWMRPDVFGPVPDGSGALGLRIVISAPDQDLTRAFAHVTLARPGDEPRATARAPSAEAESLALASVSTLLEPLRGLGGEASTANVELNVSCALSP
jgi:hypothetical protein